MERYHIHAGHAILQICNKNKYNTYQYYYAVLFVQYHVNIQYGGHTCSEEECDLEIAESHGTLVSPSANHVGPAQLCLIINSPHVLQVEAHHISGDWVGDGYGGPAPPNPRLCRLR